MTEQNTQENNQVDSELQRIIEAAILASPEPLSVRKLIALFPDSAQPSADDVRQVIASIQQQCEYRGVELKQIGKGWRFQSKEKYSPWLRKLSTVKPPRFSRALLETIAIIAYRQPVTRGDIEDIRGVAVSSDLIRTLEERGWICELGHRDVPGRPALLGTTSEFLEYFNLQSLSELPELMDKRQLGEVAKDMNLSLPEDLNESKSSTVEAVQPEQSEQTQSQSPVAQVVELYPSGEMQNGLASEIESDSEVDNNEELTSQNNQGASDKMDDELTTDDESE